MTNFCEGLLSLSLSSDMIFCGGCDNEILLFRRVRQTFSSISSHCFDDFDDTTINFARAYGSGLGTKAVVRRCVMGVEGVIPLVVVVLVCMVFGCSVSVCKCRL